jgi:hypothetical protein
MKTSDSFRSMTSAFHQDSHLCYDSAEDMFDAAVGCVAPDDRADLAAFLDEILAAGPQACREAWENSRAEFEFARLDDLMSVLRDIRKRL